MIHIGVFLFFLVTSGSFGAQAQNRRCGRRQGFSPVKDFRSSRIVNGDAAWKNEWPWLVAFVKIPEEKFFCGGSLVSRKHILSGEWRRLKFIFSR